MVGIGFYHQLVDRIIMTFPLFLVQQGVNGEKQTLIWSSEVI